MAGGKDFSVVFVNRYGMLKMGQVPSAPVVITVQLSANSSTSQVSLLIMGSRASTILGLSQGQF